MSRLRLPAALAAGILALALSSATPTRATEIWSGRTHFFFKSDFADWTLPANQDRLTDNVWLTRANTRGLFNIKSETGYLGASPAGTEWATGNAADHASLTFAPWVTWAANNPPGTLGVDAVVHLIAEDIYVDIRFDAWSSGLTGGGFSYTRAEKPTTGVAGGTTAFALRGLLGNPARAGARIEFALPDDAPATLEVLDVGGRLVASRAVGGLGAGVHRVELAELRALPPGLVFVRLRRGDRSLVARATLLD